MDAILKKMHDEKAAAKFLTKLGFPVKAQTARKWRYAGRGPAYVRVAGRVRYVEEDLIAFVQASRIDPTTRKPRRRRSRK